jgi:thiamine pyrophosphokinase
MTTTVLILGGEPPPPELVHNACHDADFRLAADSGYDAFAAAGMEPDLLIGDFDSLATARERIGCRKIHAPEETATDFEKALRKLPADTQDLHILGGTGRRADHFLNNLLIAAALDPALRVAFLDPQQELVRVTPRCPLQRTTRSDQLVSIVPFRRCEGVTTEGLLWDLKDSPMNAEEQLSQSNRATGKEIRVALRSGTAYVVLNR